MYGKTASSSQAMAPLVDPKTALAAPLGKLRVRADYLAAAKAKRAAKAEAMKRDAADAKKALHARVVELEAALKEKEHDHEQEVVQKAKDAIESALRDELKAAAETNEDQKRRVEQLEKMLKDRVAHEKATVQKMRK